MKKTIFFPAGHRRRNEDHVHLTDGVTEALSAIISCLPDNVLGCRLSGCAIVDSGGGNTTDVADGFIAIWNGTEFEICKVDAHQTTKTGGQIFGWEIVETFADVTPRLYADNVTTHNVLRVTKGRIKAYEFADLGTFMPYKASFPIELIHGTWTENSHDPSKFLTDNEPAVDWDITGASYLRVRYKVDGAKKTCTVNAYILGSTVSGGNTQVLQIVLPNTIRAAINTSGSAFVFGKAGSTSTILEGQSTVNISATDFSNITGLLISVTASITFEIE